MAREVRFILFSAEETRSAVEDFLMRQRRDTKPVHVDKVDLELRDGAVAGHAHVVRGGGQLSQAFSGWRSAVTSPESALVTLSASELLASILIFCRRAQIPISSRSAKRLEISSGCLVVSMSLNTQGTQPKVEGGAVIHSAGDMSFATPGFN